MSHNHEGYRLLIIQDAEECRILERLNRFTVRVEVDGRGELAYLQNTGRLLDHVRRGRRGFCTPIRGSGKLARRLFAVDEGDLAAIVDTSLQEKAFEEAVGRGLIPWLRGHRIAGRNVRVSGSRIDYLMRGGLGEAYVELKSAVLRLGEHASYPDCPSRRARGQVAEMLGLIGRGARAILVFVAALPRIKGFKLNYEADPRLCSLISEAHRLGLEIRGIQLAYDPRSSSIILLDEDLPIEI